MFKYIWCIYKVLIYSYESELPDSQSAQDLIGVTVYTRHSQLGLLEKLSHNAEGSDSTRAALLNLNHNFNFLFLPFLLF